MDRGPSGRRARDTLPGDDRGQTHVDFLVGIVLFLVAFTFVVAAVPQLIAPYDDQTTPIVADRVAASLSESLLIGDNEPGVLDQSCVDAYFDGGDGTGCGFSTGDDLAERSGVDSYYSVNVQLTGDFDGDGTVDGTKTIGDDLPTQDRVLSMDRQVVMLNGTTATLEVRVW